MSFAQEPVRPLEASLAALRPTARLERDRLLFRAGQLAAGRRRWVWPTMTCLSTGTACWLGWLLLAALAQNESSQMAAGPGVGPVQGFVQPELPQLPAAPRQPTPPADDVWTEGSPFTAAAAAIVPMNWPRPPYVHMVDQMSRLGPDVVLGRAMLSAEQEVPPAPPTTMSGPLRPGASENALFFFSSWWR